LNARHLLAGPGIFEDEFLGEDTRVLVLNNGECSLGVIVEEVKSIEMVPEDQILSLSVGENHSIRGVYQQQSGDNILLLQLDNLVGDRRDELISMYRLSAVKEDTPKTKSGETGLDSHHLITENSYLVFSIGKFMAVQLKDVQEILEDAEILTLPGAPAYAHGVINLRGIVVPVVNVSVFIGDKKQIQRRAQNKLIICRSEEKMVALEVDTIVTIYKQEKYQNAGSLNPDLAKVADTLDRLIVFDNAVATREHVLVMNVHNLIRNHLPADVLK
jgi:purine-binding chemotaxis protein CheW